MDLFQLYVDLRGPFRLTTEQGVEIKISSARNRAMLGILACSDGNRRSREWLKAVLWPRSNEPHSSYSLRNALSSLRKGLGEHSALIQTDRVCVELLNVTMTTSQVSGNEIFFEDAPYLGEEFEDWLSQERGARARSDDIVQPRPTRQFQPMDESPCIAINAPVIESDDPLANIIANAICDQIISGVRSQGLVRVFDLRDLSSDQLAGDANPVFTPQAMVTLSFQKAQKLTSVSVAAVSPNTRQVLWNASIAADHRSNFVLTGDQMVEFISCSTDSIQNVILRSAYPVDSEPSLYTSIHQIMGMSLDGQRSARRIINDMGLLRDSGIANAWYAISIANSLGERDSRARQEQLDEAERCCALALEIDPSNPVVLALVAHVQGFLFRRLSYAATLASSARDAGHNLALVWDLSAMNALYRDDAQEAFDFSKRASLLSQYSPYRPFFLASMSISASVIGEHTTAIRTGEAILSRLPSVLAVRRYLAGSLAAVGQIDRARDMIQYVQKRDETFSLKNLSGVEATLQSAQSKRLIEGAFVKTGLIT